MQNVHNLHKAGVIANPDQLSAEEAQTINSLSSEEVESLISLRQKFASHETGDDDDAKANCFV